MPAEVTVEELLVELQGLTGMTPADWQDFLTLPADAQIVAVQAYRDQAWVQQTDTLGKVLAVLTVIGTVAGVVSGVAGAAGAVAALKSL